MEAESHPNPPRPQPQITIKRACRVGPTSFDGSGDPDSAHAWLNDLERNPMAVSWNEFKRLFNAHFYPSFYQNLKMNEFYKLVQGSMTVDAYEKKFTELSRAAPHIVENEVNRCRKFEEGLRHEMKTYVSAAEHIEYGKLVESALRVERNINEAHRFDQQRQKCSNQNWSVGAKQPMGGSQQSSSVGRFRLDTLNGIVLG
ncbi:hypothetical protein JRO89_XS09G0099300 [Xanthoceras sorbifolium]|uniref:Retrotransposon gag domain-containing protein n=1 Tax=Xanthoceras sorbifolium TaxID=99658 RepID=A0ABQ8HKX7_9ROSI|nr:hypothetical protein JRO89_XS09G0099300 [Xanthoceras sorbifolium]